MSPDADDLVVENSGNAGITILAGGVSPGSLYFASASEEARGVVQYDGAADEMVIGAATVGGDTIIRNGSEPEALRIPDNGPATFVRGVNAQSFTVDGEWLRIKDATTVDNDPGTGTLGYGGQIRRDANYLYVCTATMGQERGKWKRIQLATF